jgi:hypothetical protein
LVLIACDAGARVYSASVQTATEQGRTVVVGSKEELGGWLHRNDVAICAVTNPTLADEMLATWLRIQQIHELIKQCVSSEERMALGFPRSDDGNPPNLFQQLQGAGTHQPRVQE